MDEKEQRVAAVAYAMAYRPDIMAEAQQKRDDIIKRFGDANGVRREPWYLDHIIYECVQAAALKKQLERSKNIETAFAGSEHLNHCRA